MHFVDHVAQSPHTELRTERSRLIVTRRGINDGVYRAIGYLDHVTDEYGATVYEFRYLARVEDDPTFVPIVGFRDIQRRYRSERLFPSFADRLMSAKRPDRPQYLEALSLDTNAGAWEILAASGGHREGDPIELISLPDYEPNTGATSAQFLAHGIRYRGCEASNRITELRSGYRLSLEPDPTNSVNPWAIQIVDQGTHLGFVPDPLLNYIYSVISDNAYELTVVRANPPETHPHLRLLLRLTGRCDAWIFDGPAWKSM